MQPKITQYSDIPFEIFTIDGLYSSEEIKNYLDFVEFADEKNRGFTNSEFKNGKIIRPDISSKMYSYICPHLPHTYIDRNNTSWKFIQAPKYIMYAKIKQDQLFGLHTDTGCEYDEIDNLYSKFTVLTYLNDNFDGGHTQFYNNDFQKTVSIEPKENRTLIFDIDLYHKGDQITKGEKYWIGTELVVSKIDTIYYTEGTVELVDELVDVV